MNTSIRSPLLLLAALALTACSSMYYKTMSAFGYEKRDILVERVQEGREDQAEAKEQFKSTYEAFKALANYDGGDLEDYYEEVKDEYDRCVAQAEDVGGRIEAIEDVATDMFSEWESEIEQIQNPEIRGQSQTLRRGTQAQYAALLGAMKQAEAKMAPVLTAFNDQVLFLKHNLNARAIASLKDTVFGIESDVADLIAEMQKSIDEADAFIASVES